ncbi:hypothetical protein [Hyphomonas sp.]|uniref:hypothetical protein n=1 Tax=Hyphomonas sp. TaxID=87 RepID=UPI0032FE059D
MKPLAFLLPAALLFTMPILTANAGATVYHAGGTKAETCAARVADPEERSALVLRLCENALLDQGLTQASHAATLANAGIMKMRRGDLDAALVDFETARALGAATPDIAINLGAVLVRLGRFEEAVDVLSDPEAISVERRHVAFYNRAIAHWALDNLPRAYEDLTAATEMKSDYTAAHVLLQNFHVAEAK